MPIPFQRTLLDALNVLNRTEGKHIYAGTVRDAEKHRRRAKNRVARQSRRINRKGR